MDVLTSVSEGKSAISREWRSLDTARPTDVVSDIALLKIPEPIGAAGFAASDQSWSGFPLSEQAQ